MQFLIKKLYSIVPSSPKRKWTRWRWVKFAIFLALAIVVVVLAVISGIDTASAATSYDFIILEQSLTRNIDGILHEIDLSSLEQFVVGLTPGQQSVLGGGSALERIRAILHGEIALDYGNFFTYILEVAGISLLGFLPFMLGILAIAISINLIHSLRGKFASESVGNIVTFSGVALVSTILAVQLMIVIASARALIVGIQTQMNVVFPILLTLMAAAGGVNSAAVYQPAVAVLGSGIMSIVAAIIFPMFIISNVFTVVGNLSDTIKLKKMSTFFNSSCKWLLGTAFFLFIAFLSVQGITASIYDGVSVRTARFAISRYVPIIGGYLS